MSRLWCLVSLAFAVLAPLIAKSGSGEVGCEGLRSELQALLAASTKPPTTAIVKRPTDAIVLVSRAAEAATSNRRIPRGEAHFRISIPKADPGFAPISNSARPFEVVLMPAEGGLLPGATANGVWVTIDGPSGFLQLEPADQLTKQFQLSEANMEAMKGKRVLSVGEGMANTVPALAGRGVNVRGVDLWYDPQILELKGPEYLPFQQMQAYYLKNQRYLVGGTATALPYEDGSIDLILSHLLLNNLSSREQTQACQEMIRVLARNGEARVIPMSDLLMEEMRARFGGRIVLERRGQLAVIRKVE